MHKASLSYEEHCRYLDAICNTIYLHSGNGSNLLNEHTHAPELAPVTVTMEMVPKHKMRFYY